jgi:hypothetical protein
MPGGCLNVNTGHQTRVKTFLWHGILSQRGPRVKSETLRASSIGEQCRQLHRPKAPDHPGFPGNEELQQGGALLAFFACHKNGVERRHKLVQGLGLPAPACVFLP